MVVMSAVVFETPKVNFEPYFFSPADGEGGGDSNRPISTAAQRQAAKPRSGNIRGQLRHVMSSRENAIIGRLLIA